MTEHRFTELLGSIDPALVARAEQAVPAYRKPVFRIALVAAVLAILICTVLAVIPFIPTTLDLDYYPKDKEIYDEPENVWIWYIDQSGRQKREYVRLPGSAKNVFAAWAHLSGLDEDVELLSVTSVEGSDPDRCVMIAPFTALHDQPNSEQLLASLQKTLSRYLGVPKANLSFEFVDITTPEAETLKLELSHSLQDHQYSFMVGSTFELTVTVTNLADQFVKYEGAQTDFVPKAQISMSSGDLLPVATGGSEIGTYYLAPGQSISATYTFRVPMDAPYTWHSLVLSFGKYSETFENAVKFAPLGTENMSAAREPFMQFLQAYVPEAKEDWRQMLDGYTYMGQSIAGQMDVECIDGENFWSEIGESDHFNYAITTKSSTYGWAIKNEAEFWATKLPDGMVLPLGITVEDSVLDALTKIGFSKDVAELYLEHIDEYVSLRLAGGSIYSGDTDDLASDLWLHARDDCYVISYRYYSKVVELYYRADDLGFAHIGVSSAQTESNEISFPAPVCFSHLFGKTVDVELTNEQAAQLAKILNTYAWGTSDPGQQDCDCTGTIGNASFAYSSESGVFYMDGFTMKVAFEDHRNEIRQLLEDAKSTP